MLSPGQTRHGGFAPGTPMHDYPYSPAVSVDIQYQTPPPSPYTKGTFMQSHLFQSQEIPQYEDKLRDSTGVSKTSPLTKPLFDDYDRAFRHTPSRPPPQIYDRVSIRDEKDKVDTQAPPVQSIYDQEFPLQPAQPQITMQPKPIGSVDRLPRTEPEHRTLFPHRQERDTFNEECSVTVFGFPSVAASSLVLKQFQTYGEISRYQMGEGNWLHIEYQTKLQAQRALGKNGKLIDDQTMVGVIPYSSQRTKAQRKSVGVSLTSPRPLGNAPLPVQKSKLYPVDTTTNVQAPRPSYWSKITEYIFGW